MVANEIVELLKVTQQYTTLYNKKESNVRSTFPFGSVSFEPYFSKDAFIFKTKHGKILKFIVSGVQNSTAYYPAKCMLSTLGCKTYIIAQAPFHEYMYDFIAGNEYVHEDRATYNLDPIDKNDLESFIFQQSLLHQYPEEIGVAAMYVSGYVPMNFELIEIRLESHLGSCTKTLNQITTDIRQYLKYVR